MDNWKFKGKYECLKVPIIGDLIKIIKVPTLFTIINYCDHLLCL